jgi:ABC-type Mn2+/Zn2+ transport system ATPase subunit
MSSIVIARGVSYEFSNGRELFKHLNFSLDAKLSALVGANGVGKTCLAKLIAGDLEPTEGVVRRIGSSSYSRSARYLSVSRLLSSSLLNTTTPALQRIF